MSATADQIVALLTEEERKAVESARTMTPLTLLMVVGTVKAEALRGVAFRVAVACDGYSSLTESDVPDSVVCDEDYLQGAHDAAVAIRLALAHPSTDPDG